MPNLEGRRCNIVSLFIRRARRSSGVRARYASSSAGRCSARACLRVSGLGMECEQRGRINARSPATPGPADLRDALRVIDRQVNDYVARARLGKAA